MQEFKYLREVAVNKGLIVYRRVRITLFEMSETKDTLSLNFVTLRSNCGHAACWELIGQQLGC